MSHTVRHCFSSLLFLLIKVDIFEYDMVLVPVHMGMHWCLAAVDFGSKCVSYYDSLHGNNNACLRRLRYSVPVLHSMCYPCVLECHVPIMKGQSLTISCSCPPREYINDESKDKKGVEIDLTDWTSSTPKDIPYQMNGSDCGVFSCMVRGLLTINTCHSIIALFILSMPDFLLSALPFSSPK